MKKDDLQKKTDKELQKELASKRETLREFRFGMSGSKTRDVNVAKTTRKEIARILTEITKRNA